MASAIPARTRTGLGPESSLKATVFEWPTGLEIQETATGGCKLRGSTMGHDPESRSMKRLDPYAWLDLTEEGVESLSKWDRIPHMRGSMASWNDRPRAQRRLIRERYLNMALLGDRVSQALEGGGRNEGLEIAKNVLKDNHFKKKVSSVTALTLYLDSDRAKELLELGATILPHKPGDPDSLVKSLQDAKADTICLLPPGHKDLYKITLELINASKKANVPNMCFILSAGCDLAERDKQPVLRSVINLKMKVLEAKGDPETGMGHSPVVIRRGFYAENLLLYSHQAQEEGTLPIPIGKDHKFAPMALADVALVAAHVLSGHGKHGFDDKHRGQLIALTGPTLTTGDELATAASKALGEELKFSDISEYDLPIPSFYAPTIHIWNIHIHTEDDRSNARHVLKDEAGRSEGEIAYLLEYYALVREGKTNYISMTAFHDVTGKHPHQPEDFLKSYAEEWHPKRSSKRRKTSVDK
ncbi:hypothetical protein BJY00DRAFT_312383 [Aspergillus carlsbadensis]|nr:hypothetical protein BJY00DRAFT_312383 [Aspergillus carlsbadensis]